MINKGLWGYALRYTKNLQVFCSFFSQLVHHLTQPLVFRLKCFHLSLQGCGICIRMADRYALMICPSVVVCFNVDGMLGVSVTKEGTFARHEEDNIETEKFVEFQRPTFPDRVTSRQHIIKGSRRDAHLFSDLPLDKAVLFYVCPYCV